jgi:hypothetical protein
LYNSHYVDTKRKAMTGFAPVADIILEIQEGAKFLVGTQLVIVGDNKDGSQYLATKPDGQSYNNFDNLPTIQAVYALLKACYKP